MLRNWAMDLQAYLGFVRHILSMRPADWPWDVWLRLFIQTVFGLADVIRTHSMSANLQLPRPADCGIDYHASSHHFSASSFVVVSLVSPNE